MKKKFNFINITWLLFYLMIFFLLLNNSLSYLDPDFGWHLKVGQAIWEEKSVPTLEQYDFTLKGKSWVDHEWLLNVFIYWLYSKAGYLSVNLFFSLIIMGALFVLHKFIRNNLKEKNISIPITLFFVLGIIACLPHLGVRMQEITLLLLALELVIINNFEKKKNWKILIWLPVIFYIWANAHGGFLIGIFVLFFWTAVKLLEIGLFKIKCIKSRGKLRVPNPLNPPYTRGTFYSPLCIKGVRGICSPPRQVCREVLKNIINKISAIANPDKLEIKNIKIFFYFTVFSSAATFFTPYGIKLYYFLGDYSNGFYLKNINEWLPFYYLPIQYWQIFYIAFVIIALILTISSPLKKKLNFWEFLSSLFFVLLALKSKRHFPLLFVVSFSLVIKFYYWEIFSSWEKIFYHRLWPKQFFIIKIYIIAGLLLISGALFIKTKPIKNPFAYFSQNHPYGAVNYLKGNPQFDKNLFCDYNWGGYIIWTLPKKRLFIDGRLPQYPYAGHTLLEEYKEFFKEGRAEIKLSQYRINLVLLKNKDDYYHLNWFEKYFLGLNENEINKKENFLKKFLNSSAQWQKVYSDEISVIYQRKNIN